MLLYSSYKITTGKKMTDTNEDLYEEVKQWQSKRKGNWDSTEILSALKGEQLERAKREDYLCNFVISELLKMAGEERTKDLAMRLGEGTNDAFIAYNVAKVAERPMPNFVASKLEELMSFMESVHRRGGKVSYLFGNYHTLYFEAFRDVLGYEKTIEFYRNLGFESLVSELEEEQLQNTIQLNQHRR